MKLPTLFPSETRNQGSARGGFLLIIAFILIIFFFLIMILSNKKDGEMVNPFFHPSLSPTPIPPKAPKTFQFDSSTDLRQELETVNPQVLDSDFE